VLCGGDVMTFEITVHGGITSFEHAKLIILSCSNYILEKMSQMKEVRGQAVYSPFAKHG
jgi:hypothetical protein